MAGTKFWFHGYDKTRGFDKYQISDKAPADPASVSFTATFSKDADGKLKFRTENAKDPTDPPRIYPVELTYGGGVYKQRYLYRVGANLFPFVQFNQKATTAMATAAASPGAITTPTGCSTRKPGSWPIRRRPSPSTRNARAAITTATR